MYSSIVYVYSGACTLIRVVVKWRLCSMLFLYLGFSVLLLWRFSRTALFIFFVLFAHLQSWCSSFLALRHSGVAALFVFCCFGSRFSSIHTPVFYPLFACACVVDDLQPVWRSTASVVYRFLACVLAVHCVGPLGGRLLLYCCNVLVLRGSILLSFVRRSGVPRRCCASSVEYHITHVHIRRHHIWLLGGRSPPVTPSRMSGTVTRRYTSCTISRLYCTCVLCAFSSHVRKSQAACPSHLHTSALAQDCMFLDGSAICFALVSATCAFL